MLDEVCLLERGWVYRASVRNSIWPSFSTARLRYTPRLVGPATRHCYCLLQTDKNNTCSRPGFRPPT
jgi:hypothetical protein